MQTIAMQPRLTAVDTRLRFSSPEPASGAAEEAAAAFLDSPPSGWGIRPLSDHQPWRVDSFTEDGRVEAVSSARDPERGPKEAVIRGMIRKSPHDDVTARLVESLSSYPLEALQAVADYGTRIEAYDFDAGDPVPEYLPTLAHSGVVGAYNTKANVLGFDRRNADTFTILHEFAHALDAALCEPSATPDWKGAHAFAKSTNRVVRDYAKSDPSEYLAENTCAYLIADERLPALVDRGLEEGALGLGERQYLQMCQNLCNGRLHALDPDGYALVDDLLHARLKEGPRRPASPAMTEAQYHAFREKEHSA